MARFETFDTLLNKAKKLFILLVVQPIQSLEKKNFLESFKQSISKSKIFILNTFISYGVRKKSQKMIKLP